MLCVIYYYYHVRTENEVVAGHKFSQLLSRTLRPRDAYNNVYCIVCGAAFCALRVSTHVRRV